MTEAGSSQIMVAFSASALVVVIVLAAYASTNRAPPPITMAPYCLVSIPSGAQIGYHQNGTFYGDVVDFRNGTTKYYSYYSCPRPAMGDEPNGPPLDHYNFTTNVFAMAAAAESNDTFSKLENGGSFLFDSTSGLGCESGTDVCGLDLFFYSYGGNVSHPCGPMTYQRNIIGGILAAFQTSGNYVNGQWVSHGWDLRNPTLHVLSPDEIMMYTTQNC